MLYKEQIKGEIHQGKVLTADKGHVAAMTAKLLSNSQKVSVLTVIMCVLVFGKQTHAFQMLTCMLLCMSMGRGYVSELRPPTGVLFITQVVYESGERRSNNINIGKPKNSKKNRPQCLSVHHKSTM
jgi:hypothetical protein